ncbi:MAG: 5-(carboxyamino)imidazole ribonucleotide mutase [Candidatus Liberibacter europaeus]|uniref:N5-carboxyaminoimidazole ribonucleotide mutase n=1 Tax=Candidatus Liberibacter europaeus TaxID=744859 RepID=A0A2T4VY66_9HYPH|nr:5-(carboxyamino)imidazole ribonucleotide mutase [Candidatus Liberibacter europaeus]PTL86718.1 MAG: 5-(carboxyamino)imidazole ribonucleotide mutase [Candidatus Liberibacter europaeus]
MSIAPPIAIIMGSQSDWRIMKYTADMLDTIDVDYETRIISAHRTPDRLVNFSKNARFEGFKLIIAGAGGAAHLPGMIASMTSLPVLGVPIMSHALRGLDSLLSIVQMPAGIPVGTMAIGQSGAVNAALLAISILALNDDDLTERLDDWRIQQTASISEYPKDFST